MLSRIAACSLMIALGACTTVRSDGSPQVQTTPEAKRENFGGAMSAPLRDLNMLRVKIPDVLLQALADPYARPPGPADCDQLIALIRPLDGALGADLDEPSVDEDDLMDKGKGAALTAVAGVTSDIIPFRGWVRKLTGAERHDGLVQAAIAAGGVRRGYLKGLGEANGCNPPATPSHALAGSPVISQHLKPRYEIR